MFRQQTLQLLDELEGRRELRDVCDPGVVNDQDRRQAKEAHRLGQALQGISGGLADLIAIVDVAQGHHDPAIVSRGGEAGAGERSQDGIRRGPARRFTADVGEDLETGRARVGRGAVRLGRGVPIVLFGCPVFLVFGRDQRLDLRFGGRERGVLVLADEQTRGDTQQLGLSAQGDGAGIVGLWRRLAGGELALERGDLSLDELMLGV